MTELPERRHGRPWIEAQCAVAGCKFKEHTELIEKLLAENARLENELEKEQELTLALLEVK